MNLSFYYNQIPDNASNEDKKLFVLAMSEKLRQSNEWDLLGILLDDFSKRFFFDFEISYKALLGLLDASRYDAAKLHLNYLYNNLNLSFDSSRLVGIFRAASNLGMHDIALNVFNIFEATCSENFLNLSSVSFRLHKASSFGKIKFPNIVSLGENCLPWMLPNRWGLRNQASIVNDNSLFNLGQTSTEKVSLIIEERASRFLSMPNLELFRSDYSVYPKNNLYHYDFNHEQGDFWIANNFSNLVKKYNLKINKFLNFITSNDPTIYFHYVEFPGDLNPIVNSFLNMPNSNISILLIVDVRVDFVPLIDFHPNVFYLPIRKPSPSYQWFKPDDIDSAAGVYFEHTIVNMIVSCSKIITEQFSSK